MTKERWDDLVTTILDRFPIDKRGQEPLEEGPGQRDFIEFTSPAGKMRLELVTRPVVLGKHTFGGRKIGTATGVSYDYSSDEFTHSLNAYQWLNGAWDEIDAKAFAKE
jgi:hypothetical protein